MRNAPLADLVRKAESAFRERRGNPLSTSFLLDDRHALDLLLALRREYGPDVVTWEPESLWLLKDFSLMNRDKILAANTLCTHPTLFTEPRGFAAIALTLSSRVPETIELTPAPPDAMAWAVVEGELIYSLANPSETPEYGPDVIEYIALSLLHEGFVLAPELLSFADDALAAHLTDEGRALRTDVQEAWKALADDALEELHFPESAEGVQLARLAAVEIFCGNQTRSLLAALP